MREKMLEFSPEKKKYFKNPKKCIIIFFFKLCFSINVLTSAKGDLYLILTVIYI